MSESKQDIVQNANNSTQHLMHRKLKNNTIKIQSSNSELKGDLVSKPTVQAKVEEEIAKQSQKEGANL